MENFKPFDDLFEADDRNLHFGLEKPTLRRHYDLIAEICLNDYVDEDVRSYFNSIKNLCVYAWCDYSLYALCEFLSTTAIELALNLRLGHSDPKQRKPGLRKALEEARNKGLLTDDGFEVVRRQRSINQLWEDRPDDHHDESNTRYVDILIQTLPFLRNHYSHPDYHPVRLPADARSSLRLTAEIINQIYRPGAAAADSGLAT
jgi:hypothetical protein